LRIRDKLENLVLELFCISTLYYSQGIRQAAGALDSALLSSILAEPSCCFGYFSPNRGLTVGACQKWFIVKIDVIKQKVVSVQIGRKLLPQNIETGNRDE
jgi:hypothetical protein